MRICCVTKSLKGLLNWRCYLTFVVKSSSYPIMGAENTFFSEKGTIILQILWYMTRFLSNLPQLIEGPGYSPC